MEGIEAIDEDAEGHTDVGGDVAGDASDFDGVAGDEVG